MFIVENIKTYCAVCKGREAFNAILSFDLSSGLITAFEQHKTLRVPTFKLSFNRAKFQMFVMIFQCQACQGIPETFLVRRAGSVLYLHGRSPMETVQIPNFFPDKEGNWYRDALVAFNSHKVLAGLFYLRTFIEQFARRMTGLLNAKATGEEIMEAYAELIPLKHRDTMPSLLEWYQKLSAAIHGADENEELFNTARAEIEKSNDISTLDGYTNLKTT